MAFVYIREYLRQPKDGIGGLLPAGMEPAITTQKIAISAGSLQSAPFNALTTFVCVQTDAAMSYLFGANPVATAADMRMPLDGTQFFGVRAGDRIAIITNT